MAAGGRGCQSVLKYTSVPACAPAGSARLPTHPAPPADTYVRRLMAYGMAGLSVVADSLSAIKFGKVFPVYNDQGIMVDFK